MIELTQLYTQTFGSAPAHVIALSQEGSNRRYYRMESSDGCSVIGCVGTSAEENSAFCHLAQSFSAKNLPVPQVLAVSDDHLRYLQEDLGSTAMYELLGSGRRSGGNYNAEEKKLLTRAMQDLPRLQFEGASDDVFNHCYPLKAMDEMSVMWDLNYFKYCYLKLCGVEFNELLLEHDLRQFCTDLLSHKTNTFQYRDFQARNIMVRAGELYYIDFQGGRRGPFYYDVASFLWQASAKYPDSLRDELITTYVKALQPYHALSESDFRSNLQIFVLFRLLQVLGAYGYRGLWEKKPHFVQSIPPALANLRELVLKGGCDAYPYLRSIALAISEPQPVKPKRKQLVVRVFSFSYKKGIPTDESGNGGGYVFDCRSTHNPGRYEPYKKLTGRDKPVIGFLEDNGEILDFLDSVYRLADFHVQRYIDRGFTDLMFSFGCTGGQHRSVYSAQHVAEHINRKFGIEVQLCHREQKIHEVLPAQSLQAMVLAAGLGTRLKPLTDTMPKALVPVASQPLLQHTLNTLKAAGANAVTINVHHFADQIEQYLQRNPQSGLDIHISDERQQLLETGGALKHARQFFRPDSPVLIHNVDILSNVSLTNFYQLSIQHDAMLLVSKRDTQRYLLFDADMHLVGWTNIKTGEVRSPYKDLDIAKCQMYAFSGIHCISPRLMERMDSYPDRFSIIDFYLDQCISADICGYVRHDLRLMDVGKQETLHEAEDFFKEINSK